MKTGEIKSILGRLGIRPSRARSQIFLTDEKIAGWQVGLADILKNETVLEIGAGLGILTKHILEFTDKITVIENDKRLAGYLEDEFGIGVICDDVLDVELPEFDKVISNLPYHISSEITAKLLKHDFKKGILMFQKEFAGHLVAQPGSRDYSRISVLALYHADTRIVKTVPKGAYYPVPKVDSAIVEMVPRPPKFIPQDEDFYFKVVRLLFSHKNRKTRNALLSEHKQLAVPKDDMKKWVDDVPHAGERAVRLSPEQLNEISNYLSLKILTG